MNLLGAPAARAGRLEKALKAFKKVVFWGFFFGYFGSPELNTKAFSDSVTGAYGRKKCIIY